MTNVAKIKGLYHFSFPCRDAEETRAFYEDLLGLPLVNFMSVDKVPSTGEEKPYAHMFFELGDGSYVAFFDLGENEMPKPSPNTPDWVQHLALEVPSVEDVVNTKERLLRAGVDVKGVVDHEFVQSLYFFDPNGLRLEITARTEEPGYLEAVARSAHRQIKEWSLSKKERLKEKGQPAKEIRQAS